MFTLRKRMNLESLRITVALPGKACWHPLNTAWHLRNEAQVVVILRHAGVISWGRKNPRTTFPTRQGRADRGIHGGNSVLIPRIIFLASTVYKKYRIAYKCCSYLIPILRVHGAPRSTKLTNDPPEQLPQKSVCQGSVHHMHDMLDHLKHDRAKIPASAAFGIYGWLLDRTFSAI